MILSDIETRSSTINSRCRSDSPSRSKPHPAYSHHYKVKTIRAFQDNRGINSVDSHFLSGLIRFRFNGRFDSDLIDRLSHTYTPMLLIIFTLVTSTRQYMGKPINCWLPTEFTRGHEEFAENVCWVTNTYFVPPGQPQIPVEPAKRRPLQLNYYQWVPFVLMLQALLFSLPLLLWRLFNWQSGWQIHRILEVASSLDLATTYDERRSTINYLACYITDILDSRHHRHNKFPSANTATREKHHTNKLTRKNHLNRQHNNTNSNSNSNSQQREHPDYPHQNLVNLVSTEKKNAELRSYRTTAAITHKSSTSTSSSSCTLFWNCRAKLFANYLVMLNLTCKFVQLGNILGQIVLMNRFIVQNYSTWYGVQLLVQLANGQRWTESGLFPRITLCDFKIRKLANIHLHTVQCVLPINMLNEKIYIFLWFWLVLLALTMVFSLLKCGFQFIFTQFRMDFVKNLLQQAQSSRFSISYNMTTEFENDLTGYQSPAQNIISNLCTKLHIRGSSFSHFIRNHLQQDGVFILRLILMNSSAVSTSLLVNRLWEIYMEDMKLHQRENSSQTFEQDNEEIGVNHSNEIGNRMSHYHANHTRIDLSRRNSKRKNSKVVASNQLNKKSDFRSRILSGQQKISSIWQSMNSHRKIQQVRKQSKVPSYTAEHYPDIRRSNETIDFV